jgi:hypothetical protein
MTEEMTAGIGSGGVGGALYDSSVRTSGITPSVVMRKSLRYMVVVEDYVPGRFVLVRFSIASLFVWLD